MYSMRIEITNQDDPPASVTWELNEWSAAAAREVFQDVQKRMSTADSANCHPWQITARGDEEYHVEWMRTPHRQLCATDDVRVDSGACRSIRRRILPLSPSSYTTQGES